MKVIDNRTITVQIDGKNHTLSLSDLQRLYDMIGGVVGISRHNSGRLPYTWPYQTVYGSNTMSCSTNAMLPKADPEMLVLNTEVAA